MYIRSYLVHLTTFMYACASSIVMYKTYSKSRYDRFKYVAVVVDCLKTKHFIVDIACLPECYSSLC